MHCVIPLAIFGYLNTDMTHANREKNWASSEAVCENVSEIQTSAGMWNEIGR